MTDPRLIELARQAAGLTQGALAQRLGKSQPFVSQVERGERDIPQDLLESWALACDVSSSFFGRRTGPMPPGVAGMVHRRMKTLPGKAHNQSIARIQMTSLEVDSLFAEVDLVPALQIPEVDEGVSPEAAAAVLRRTWRIAEGPLPNLVDLVESAGVPVIAMEGFHEKHSATTHRGQCFTWLIALNENHPGSRRRFTLAHELGHLVLGHDKLALIDEAESQRIETEADRFASALLMPPEAARRELRRLSLRRLVQLKERWLVSVSFLIRTAEQIGAIKSDESRRLYIDLAQQPGGKRREPGEFPAEEPSLVKRIVESLQSDGLSLETIAEIATTRRETVEHRYLGHRPRLRLVTSEEVKPRLRLEEPPSR